MRAVFIREWTDPENSMHPGLDWKARRLDPGSLAGGPASPKGHRGPDERAGKGRLNVQTVLIGKYADDPQRAKNNEGGRQAHHRGPQPPRSLLLLRQGFSRRVGRMACPWLSGSHKSDKVGRYPDHCPLASPGTGYHIRPERVNRSAAEVFGNGHRGEGPGPDGFNIPIIRTFRLRPAGRGHCEKFLE
jgi:hypothetical protein